MLYAVAACTWRRVLSGENVIMFARTCLSGGTNTRAQLSSNSRIAISCLLSSQTARSMAGGTCESGGAPGDAGRPPMASPRTAKNAASCIRSFINRASTVTYLGSR
jgi:hypothetical protein